MRKSLAVPGCIVVEFRDPPSVDTCRFILEDLSECGARILRYSRKRWVLRVHPGKERQEITRLMHRRYAYTGLVARQMTR